MNQLDVAYNLIGKAIAVIVVVIFFSFLFLNGGGVVISLNILPSLHITQHSHDFLPLTTLSGFF